MNMQQTVVTKATAPAMTEVAFLAMPPSVSAGLTDGSGVGRYQPAGTSKLVSLGIVMALHVGALFLLIAISDTGGRPVHSDPLVVNLLPPDRPPPAPQPRPSKKQAPQLPRRTVPQTIVPPPLVEVRAVTGPLAMVAPPPSPAPEAVADVENPEPKPSMEPIASDNLTLKLIAANPPTYPIASRRRREQGEVLLEIVVGIDGKVEEISVRRSSGFENLDRAALVAVRRWRWSPTVINQQAVRVRGVVRIPFELRG